MSDISKVSITKEMALKMLGALYEHQRPYLKRTAQRYADDMLNGRWQSENPAPIVISDTGKLLDGQHRLHAIVMSGVTTQMYVATGVPESVYKSIDSGTIRSVSHRLNIPQKNNVAAIAKRIVTVNRGCGLITALRGTENVSQQEILSLIERDTEYLLEIVRASSRVRDALACGSVAMYGIVLHMFRAVYGSGAISDIEHELQNPSKSTMAIQRYIARQYAGKSAPKPHDIATGFVQYCSAVMDGRQLSKVSSAKSAVEKLDKAYMGAVGTARHVL